MTELLQVLPSVCADPATIREAEISLRVQQALIAVSRYPQAVASAQVVPIKASARG